MKKEIKEEKKEAKKEEKKEVVKDYSIDEKSQKGLKGISKAFYIIAKVLKVFCIIGIVLMFLLMIALPIFTTNIKVEKGDQENVIKVFDNDYYYKRDEKNIKIYEKDEEGKEKNAEEIHGQKNIDAMNKVFDYLEDNDLSKVTIFGEIALTVAVVLLFIEIAVLNKWYQFFRNIHDKTTPFIKENVDLLKEAAKYLLIILGITVVLDICVSLMFNASITIGYANIAEILAAFLLIYIFEYGCKLQNETKGKIYSKED